MKKIISATLLSAALLQVPFAFSHCQVPCGIYDDHARVVSMLENASTAKKAVAQINALANKTDAQSVNQKVRWVMTKEDHAQKTIDTISDYFLTQRVNPTQKDYAVRLQKHHAVMIAAMKVKQNANAETVANLENSIKALQEYYPEHSHAHEDKH